MPLFVIKIIEISLKDQNNDSHVVSKVMELVAKGQKSLVTMCNEPSFSLQIIESGLKDQHNDPT